MNSCQKFLSTGLLTLLSSAAFAQAPNLGAAGDFAVLSAPMSGGAVSLTGTTITGNVGSSGAATLTDSHIIGNLVLTGADTITPPSTVSGFVTQPLPVGVVTDFNAAYTALNQTCTNNIATAAFTGVPLSVGSGVTCFTSTTGVTFTNSVLTLTGNGPWILRVTNPAGALTGTSMTVVMANGGNACNVFWQVAAAVELTTSVFQGNILANAAITTTGGIFSGRALAKAGVTMTNTIVTGCEGGLPGSVSCKKEKKGHDDDDDDDRGHGNGDDDDDDDDDDDKKKKKKQGNRPY